MIEMKTISSNELVEIDIEAFTKIHNANEMDENSLVEAITFAQNALKEANLSYEKACAHVSKEEVQVELVQFRLHRLSLL